MNHTRFFTPLQKAIVTAVTFAALTVAAFAEDRWSGLYQGIHPVDGSVDMVSVSPRNDGTFRFLLTTARYGVCGGGAGWADVTLARTDSEDTLITSEAKLACVDGSDPSAVPGFRLTMQNDGKLLQLVPLKQSDQHRAFYFHRISAP